MINHSTTINLKRCPGLWGMSKGAERDDVGADFVKFTNIAFVDYTGEFKNNFWFLILSIITFKLSNLENLNLLAHSSIWLSLIRISSERESRWVRPPPTETAFLSSKPHKVFLVADRGVVKQ
jgi:hypothetical protein